MPVFDNDLMFRTTGNLTASVNCTSLKLRGTAIKGAAVRISIPSSKGTTNTLLPSVHVSDDNSTFRLASTYPGGAKSWASGAVAGPDLIVPFVTDKKYARLVLTVAGSTGTPNWGVVVAGLVLGAGYDFSRSVDFS